MSGQTKSKQANKPLEGRRRGGKLAVAVICSDKAYAEQFLLVGGQVEGTTAQDIFKSAQRIYRPMIQEERQVDISSHKNCLNNIAKWVKTDLNSLMTLG